MTDTSAGCLEEIPTALELHMPWVAREWNGKAHTFMQNKQEILVRCVPSTSMSIFGLKFSVAVSMLLRLLIKNTICLLGLLILC